MAAVICECCERDVDECDTEEIDLELVCLDCADTYYDEEVYPR